VSGRGWWPRLLAVCRPPAVGRPVRLAGLAALVALVALAAALSARAVAPTVAGRIYTVVEVERGLAHNQRLWVGSTVRVRGDVVVLKSISSIGGGHVSLCALKRCALSYPPMPPGARLHAVIVDDGPPLSLPAMQALFMQVNLGRKPSYPIVHVVLRVQPPVTNGVLGALRRVPAIGSFLPADATVPGHVERVYRIHILPRRQSNCARRGVWCDDALLLGSL